MEQLGSNRYESPTFYIKNGSTDFADKQKNIFDLLTVAEKEHKSHQEENDYDELPLARTEGRVSRKRARSEMKQFRGKESIFKKPETLPPRFKNRDVPDYHRHPHKWVKYSLADVSQEDMSDRSNTAAALSFLKELELRKQSEVKMEIDDAPQQIIFKPKNKFLSYHDAKVSVVKLEPTEDPDEVKPSFRSSKLVMPEYVVGQKKKVEKRKIQRTPSSDSSTNSKEIKLLHLMEEYDKEEEEEEG